MSTKRLMCAMAMLVGAVGYGYIAGACHPGLWYSVAIGGPLGLVFYRFAKQ